MSTKNLGGLLVVGDASGDNRVGEGVGERGAFRLVDLYTTVIRLWQGSLAGAINSRYHTGPFISRKHLP